MKAALAAWDGRISPVLDVSREALVLTIEGGAVVSRRIETIATPTPALKPERLEQLGVETLICGAISAPLHQALLARGIRVLGFVAGELDEVVEAFLAGALPSAELSMPGCGGARRRLRNRGGGLPGNGGRRRGCR